MIPIIADYYSKFSIVCSLSSLISKDKISTVRFSISVSFIPDAIISNNGS